LSYYVEAIKKYNVMNKEEEKAYLGERWLLVVGWWHNRC
jgi:hypothetical protein